jgi:hypothetical protein
VTIDRLSSLSAQIAALRAEMSRKSNESKGARATDDAAESPTSEHARPPDPESLRKQLMDIVRGVSLDDDDTIAHIRLRVVKAVLLWEFGPELREHGEWQPMVEKIAGSLVKDKGFRKAFNRLIADLQG